MKPSANGHAPREVPGANVVTVPPGVPFVDAMAAHLLQQPERGDSGATDGWAALTDVRVLVPTRRSRRTLIEALVRRSGGTSLILPKISAIGDVEEDDGVPEFGASDPPDDDLPGSIDDEFSLPPEMTALRRQLLLARLIRARDRDATSPAHAVRLAASLGRLLDQVTIEGLSLKDLPELVMGDLAPQPRAAELARHWQKTVQFLDIIAEVWPRILEEHEMLDAADRRNRRLTALAERWRRDPPAERVIAAGSTGSVPATAQLLTAIACLPRGLVVLPGLDREADQATWDALGPSHPQYAMARLLARIGIERSAVQVLPAARSVLREPGARARLIQAALRPPERVFRGEREKIEPSTLTDALRGIERIDAPGPEEEARSIALVMRSVAAEPKRTAALVTPDRALARRVAAELTRWSIEVDDSAGIPLTKTTTGTFLCLIARAVAEALTPVPLLALLKHPSCVAGIGRIAFLRRVRRLERRVIRGLRPPPGWEGLRARLRSALADAPVDEPTAAAFHELDTLIEALATRLAPLTTLADDGAHPLETWLNAHVRAAEALAETDQEAGAARLWSGDTGSETHRLLQEISDAASDFEGLSASAYADVLEVLLAGRPVRAQWGKHPRLFIWGPLEARLQQADVMILGGLNEESWPPRTDPGPWLSRSMMAVFGLPPPERRIGLSAHDFVQVFCAHRIVLTRAVKVEGTPTVPSRWLTRLDNTIGEKAAKGLAAAGSRWLAWQAALDQGPAAPPAERPRPTPPMAARPRTLSVTDIETWMRDPYALYAKRVLRLRALDGLDLEPGPREFGTVVHRALEAFLSERPDVTAVNAVDLLTGLFHAATTDLIDHPTIRTFWLPKFETLAHWVVDQERQRHGHIAESFGEIEGTMRVPMTGGDFTLTARADRIDRCRDGTVAVLDYKTGTLPALGKAAGSVNEVISGLAPQLPLEAAIARAGGFVEIGPARVSDLMYWQLKASGPKALSLADRDTPDVLAEAALTGLKGLIEAFDDADMAYVARPNPKVAPDHSDYDHLTRVREWSADTGGKEL